MAKAREMLDDVENVGIMQGFLDEADEAVEMEEEEDADEENSAAEVLDRRPNSPEILMNNLRGDLSGGSCRFLHAREFKRRRTPPKGRRMSILSVRRAAVG
jgi:hypothetical protein